MFEIIVGVIIIVLCVYFSLFNKQDKSSIGKNETNIQEIDFNNSLKESKENAEQKYYIDVEIIRKCVDLTKGLARNEMNTGLKMQNERGPQIDPYIAGGMASGIAGGPVGLMVAMDTMQQNFEKTQSHHELGKKIYQSGLESYISIEKLERDIEKEIANLRKLEYTQPDEELMDYIEISVSNIMDCNNGYLEMIVDVRATKDDFVFPDGMESSAKIDGSICIKMYDITGQKLLAYGYYNAPKRYGNDLSKAGFNLNTDNKRITLKLIPGMVFNKNEDYSISISEPNLWLLKK